MKATVQAQIPISINKENKKSFESKTGDWGGVEGWGWGRGEARSGSAFKERRENSQRALQGRWWSDHNLKVKVSSERRHSGGHCCSVTPLARQLRHAATPRKSNKQKSCVLNTLFF